jgi:hypothetical protein
MTPVRVVADVHGMAGWLQTAIAGADRPLVLLGDLVDRGPDSPGALRAAVAAIEAGTARLVRSNHDDKLFRVLTGGKPRIGGDLAATLAALDSAPDAADLKAGFVRAYAAAPLWINRNDYTFVHGAFHPDMIDHDDPGAIVPRAGREKLRYLALFGQGRIAPGETLPSRTYGWTRTIPAARTVVVGHDVRSMDAPLVVANTSGGRAIFLDTGAGKGGRLSWIDLPEEQIGSVG